MRDNPLLKRDIPLVVLFSVLSISLAWNVMLMWKLEATQAAGKNVRLDIGVGTVLPDVSALTIAGAPHRVTFHGDVPTILYVMSPTCAWCDRNHENIVALSRAKMSEFSFVGLAVGHDLAALRQYLASKPLPFDVFEIDSDDVVKAIGLGLTPQTALVSANGTVKQAWSGAFFAQYKIDIERFFHVALPGITGLPLS